MDAAIVRRSENEWQSTFKAVVDEECTKSAIIRGTVVAKVDVSWNISLGSNGLLTDGL